MRVLHSFSGVFDDPNLVSCAGLAPVLALAERSSGLFPFPKSVYAVRDVLSTVVGSRPNALILDFFAGSGTTLHSTALLNAIDNGNRRCILVTNNEVDEKTAVALEKNGKFRGDPEFEAMGIYERVSTLVTLRWVGVGVDVPGQGRLSGIAATRGEK